MSKEPVKAPFIFTGVLCLVLGSATFGQKKTEATKATLHVTSVRQAEAEDYCQTNECSATRFTVEGYVDVKGDPDAVEYALECVETWAMKPKPHVTGSCIKVHAHNDYLVKVFPEAVFFEHEGNVEGIELGYKILSEKEVRKQKGK